MSFKELEAKLVQLEEEVLLGAEKVTHLPFKLAYRKRDMLIVRDSEPGDLPQRDIVFNGWRCYNLGEGFYVRVTGPAGRVVYLRESQTDIFQEMEDWKQATPYLTELAACEASERADAGYLRDQRVIITVCSTDEFEGE